jgi:hypothetical protein
MFRTISIADTVENDLQIVETKAQIKNAKRSDRRARKQASKQASKTTTPMVADSPEPRTPPSTALISEPVAPGAPMRLGVRARAASSGSGDSKEIEDLRIQLRDAFEAYDALSASCASCASCASAARGRRAPLADTGEEFFDPFYF